MWFQIFLSNANNLYSDLWFQDFWPSRLEQENTSTTSLQRGKTSPTSVLVYDIKQPDGDAPIMLELWRTGSTPSLLLFPNQLWSGVGDTW